MKKSHIEAMQTCKRHNMSILKKQQETEYSQLEKRLQVISNFNTDLHDSK